MRSVVLKGAERCASCQLLLRWCICAARREVVCPLQIDLLTHRREQLRPSSTGNLIHRTVTGSRQHLWAPDAPVREADVVLPGRELWILHPSGRAAPTAVDASKVQLVLLDGSWSETANMARQVASWGTRISLPMTGESRFWLRAKQEGNRYSTAEALIHVLAALGLATAAHTLSLQFELHVYASLRARGQLGQAAAFLAGSPLRNDMAGFLAELQTPRPLPAVNDQTAPK